jgi:hypothetical protein
MMISDGSIEHHILHLEAGESGISDLFLCSIERR